VPESKHANFTTALLMMKNISELLKSVGDREKELLIFIVYFINFASSK